MRTIVLDIIKVKSNIRLFVFLASMIASCSLWSQENEDRRVDFFLISNPYDYIALVCQLNDTLNLEVVLNNPSDFCFNASIYTALNSEVRTRREIESVKSRLRLVRLINRSQRYGLGYEESIGVESSVMVSVNSIGSKIVFTSTHCPERVLRRLCRRLVRLSEDDEAKVFLKSAISRI